MVDDQKKTTQEKPQEKEEEKEEVPVRASVVETPPAPIEKPKSKIPTAAIMIFLFLFGISGWVYHLTDRFREKTDEETTTETTTETETAEEAEETLELLTREVITLEILNGSGVAGAAAETADIFEELGYEILEIGNADETIGNQLYVNPEVADLIAVLLEDVEGELDIASVSGELEDSSASARIILGE